MSRTVNVTDAVEIAPPGQFGEEIHRQYKLQRVLTPDVTQRFEAQGDRRLRALVRRVVDDDARHEKRSKLIQENDNYRIYEVLDSSDEDTRGNPEAPPALLTMKGVLLLQNSSCEQVMELLATPAYADLFGSLYADSAVLWEPPHSTTAHSTTSRSSTLSATPMATSLAYHWLMLRDVSALLPPRDFLFMRYNQQYASDDPASSQRVGWGASIYESIALPSCRPLWPASVSQRSAWTKCGFIVEASDHRAHGTDTTRVTFFVTAPRAADRQWLMKLAGCVKLLPSAIVNHRIRCHQLVDKREWVTRDACAQCTVSFSKLLKRRHHCRLCGASVCSKCTAMRHQNTVRVCRACLHGQDTRALWGNVSMTRKHFLGGSHTASSVSHTGSCSWDPSTMMHTARGEQPECWSSSSCSSSDHAPQSFDLLSASGSTCYSRGSALEDFLENDPMAKTTLSASTISIGSMSISSTASIDEDDALENSNFDYQLTYAKGNPWPDAPVQAGDGQRLQRIKTLNLSAQYAKEHLKELLDLARTSIGCPVAAVGVVSVSKILLVTSVGLAGDQLPRDVGFEAHTIMSSKPMIVLDTQNDERFAMNPLVSSMNIRFYIGLPLTTKDGVVVGALSLGDTSPRERVNGSDLRSLQRLASRILQKMDTGNPAAKTTKVSGVLLI